MQSLRLICPTRVVRPNWKAECVERRPLRLEGGKDCKVLPILTWVGVSPPGYPVAHNHYSDRMQMWPKLPSTGSVI